MIKILIADDHSIVRMGLKRILNEDSNIEVSGEAGNHNEVLSSLSASVPDILLLDISMPGRDGLETLKEVKTRYPNVKVIMLSMHPEDRYAIRSIKAGASGYVSKECATEDLINAIHKVASGTKYLSKALAEKMIEYIGIEMEMPPHELLSDREFQVLRKIAEGKSIDNIAEELILSPNTVSTYRERILQKLKLKTNVDLTSYAHRNHLID
jgi:two-component system, NarL family, invasion response regulator UvrY